MELRLPGGRNNDAVRVGHTVRRKTRIETPAIHALLGHLHSVGFDRVPRPLGIDEQGREVLTYLAGETIGEDRPWPSWARSDDALLAAGTWLREFHAAVSSFVPPPGARWHERDELQPGEIIGHNDAAPYNAVWRVALPGGPCQGDDGQGDLVGFIDWDLAGPCLPVRDLAFVALTWVPLTARDVAVRDGFPPDLDRARRMCLLLDSYRWAGDADEMLAAVRQRTVDHASGLRAAAQAGYEPAIQLIAEGVANDFDQAVAELDADRDTLLTTCRNR